MARSKITPVPFRRKREGKTDYAKRKRFLVSGKPRLTVRFTGRKIIAQIISFVHEGDQVLVGVDSSALKKLGWIFSGKSIPAAYLTGLLLGTQALAANQKQAILDTGFKSPMRKGKVFAFLKGVVDSGLEIPHGNEEIFPDEGRISGKQIVDYATSMEGGSGQFSAYLKAGKIEELPTIFESVKKKIMEK